MNAYQIMIKYQAAFAIVYLLINFIMPDLESHQQNNVMPLATENVQRFVEKALQVHYKASRTITTTPSTSTEQDLY